jgi:lipopolysaccharide cholinephosphotransferase
MQLKLTLILILIILILIFCHNNLTNVEQFNKSNIMTNNKILTVIRDMLKDLHGLFTTFDIMYWMDGGTLLGAVRHQDVIPWDDDADLCIDNNDKSKFLKLEPYLNEMGYGLAPFWGGYRVFPLNGIDIKYYNANWKWNNNLSITEKDINYLYPFVDIFFCNKINNIYHYTNDKVRKNYPNYYHTVDNLLPLKEYKFNDFVLMGPKNPIPYLDKAFGTDWVDTGYKNYDHENMRFLPIQKFKI